jgi:hypothetical protein
MSPSAVSQAALTSARSAPKPRIFPLSTSCIEDGTRINPGTAAAGAGTAATTAALLLVSGLSPERLCAAEAARCGVWQFGAHDKQVRG